MELTRGWADYILSVTWGKLAYKWYERSARKRHLYGDFFVIPPGYEFRGWVHKKPANPGVADPLDQVSTIGYKLYPIDRGSEVRVRVED